jgi:hypothetical protein
MNQGRERFYEELSALNDEGAAHEMNSELNSMGKMNDVAQESELQQFNDFAQEQEGNDTEARLGRKQMMRENVLFSAAIDAMHDLAEKCGIKDHLPLESVLDDLENKSEAAMIAETADRSSRFSKNPVRMAEFVTGMKGLIDMGVVTPYMSFAKVLDILEKKYEENRDMANRVTELDDRESSRKSLSQLIDLCAFIEDSPKDLIKKFHAERIKRNPLEDTLIVKITCHDEAVGHLFDKLHEIPRSNVEQVGQQLIFSAPFRKKFLDEARKKFSWVR